MRLLKKLLRPLFNLLTEQQQNKVRAFLRIFKMNVRGNFWKNYSLVQDLEHSEAFVFSKLKCDKNRFTRIKSPKITQEDASINFLPSICGPQPNIEIISFSNVIAVGHSLAIHCNGFMFQPEICVQDESHDKKHHFFDYKYKNGALATNSVRCLFKSRNILSVNEAIHLLYEYSTNYYHWLFECLPRLIHFLDNCSSLHLATNTVLLVDENLPKQCLESLSILIGSSFAIVKIKDVQQVKCNTLYYVTPLWYALSNTRNKPNLIKDFLVDVYAVTILRNAFRHCTSALVPNRKIYLARRASQARKIINSLEVDELLASFDFEFIYTDTMSFSEQVKLFSEAKFIIGASGAAFSNMIFMQENTTALMFSPSIDATNYYLFQQLADVANVDFMHFLTTPVVSDIPNIHDDFLINCMALKKIITSLINE